MRRVLRRSGQALRRLALVVGLAVAVVPLEHSRALGQSGSLRDADPLLNPAAEQHSASSTAPTSVSPVEQADWHWSFLPATLLWTPPLASQWAPRLYVLPTTLHNATTQNTIDTAIGGTAGLWRCSPDELPDKGFQIDFFAAVFSRFANEHTDVAHDFRFGFPVTFACGAWSGKFGYEHTSNHLGDEFAHDTGTTHGASHRDEFALALAYRFLDNFRVYGQSAYAPLIANITGNDHRDRWDVGVEWSHYRATGWLGYPFAAFDAEFRGDENYHANLTEQIGWQWRAVDGGRSFRLVLERYDGKSPYGQFITNNEHWLGIGAFVDF
jgi:hypothetical protein